MFDIFNALYLSAVLPVRVCDDECASVLKALIVVAAVVVVVVVVVIVVVFGLSFLL